MIVAKQKLDFVAEKWRRCNVQCVYAAFCVIVKISKWKLGATSPLSHLDSLLLSADTG